MLGIQIIGFENDVGVTRGVEPPQSAVVLVGQPCLDLNVPLGEAALIFGRVPLRGTTEGFMIGPVPAAISGSPV